MAILFQQTPGTVVVGNGEGNTHGGRNNRVARRVGAVETGGERNRW